jgi:hypothetical protein
MKHILPNRENKEDDMAVLLLDRAAQLICDHQTELTEAANSSTDQSVRYINGNRCEINVEGIGMQTSFFDTKVATALDLEIFQLEGTIGTLSKNFIIGWIKKQVKESSDNDFHFGTFAIIAAFGVSDHQAPHIDMPSPLVQIGVSMTAGCDSTAYSISQNPINTPDDLRSIFLSMAKEANDQDTPTCPIRHVVDDVIARMHQSKFILELLNEYGDVLKSVKNKEFYQTMNRTSDLAIGSISMLEGGILHAGAASDKTRMILFGSAHPPESTPYNPDVQYTAAKFVFFLASLLLQSKKIEFDSIHFLLRLLAQCVQHSMEVDLDEIIGYDTFIDWRLAHLIWEIAKSKKHKTTLDKSKVIESLAKNWHSGQLNWIPCSVRTTQHSVSKSLTAFRKAVGYQGRSQKRQQSGEQKQPGSSVALKCGICGDVVDGSKMSVTWQNEGFLAQCHVIVDGQVVIDYKLASNPQWQQLCTKLPSLRTHIVQKMREHVAGKNGSCNPCSHPRLKRGGETGTLAPKLRLFLKQVKELSGQVEGNGALLLPSHDSLLRFVQKSQDMTLKERLVNLSYDFRDDKAAFGSFWLDVYNAYSKHVNMRERKSYQEIQRDQTTSKLSIVSRK